MQLIYNLSLKGFFPLLSVGQNIALFTLFLISTTYHLPPTWLDVLNIPRYIV